MKKLILLVCLFVGIGLSASVMAQSKGAAPYPGAKHHYQVNGGIDGSNVYEWKVFKYNPTGDVLTEKTSTDVIITGYTTSADVTKSGVYIQWKSDVVAANDVYYVQVKETAGSCSNTKIFKVTITASTFDLAITAPPTSCYDGDVVVSVPSATPTYTHGDATLTYKVTPTGLGSNETYSFTATPTISNGWTVKSGSPTITSGNGSISSGVVTTTDNKFVTIQYVITKTTNNLNGESANVADFTAAVVLTAGQSSLGVSSKAVAAQSATTAVARPHTTDIEAVN